MAVEISSEYLKENTQGPLQDRLRTIIKLSPLTAKYRRLIRVLSRNKKFEGSSECHITDSFDKGATHFQEHGWVLLENFFSHDFYQELKAQWPKRYEFEPPKKLTKSYDTGFQWIRNKTGEPESIHKYSSLTKLLNYLRSDKFSKRMMQFVGRNMEFVCYSFLMQTTYDGSQVVPHKDGIYNNEKAKNFLNILMFVDGTGGKNSGGLTLSRDNEQKDIIVEPMNLKNTALIYDSKANFYHGFRPLEKGKFRWSIASQFCEKSFIED